MKSDRISDFVVAPLSPPGAKAGFAVILLTIWIVCYGFAHPAQAEVRVSGAADAVVIETQQATLEEVLRALQTSFRFRYSSAGPLDRVVMGRYSGSLSRVVTHLLEGQNFVAKSSQDNLEVIILGSTEPARATGSTPPPGLNQAAAAPPQPPQGGSQRECKYLAGDHWIPVEC
jgi:hypothetical protein